MTHVLEATRFTKCISADSSLRAVIVQAKGLPAYLSTLHQIKGQIADAMTEASFAGLLIASYLKSGERVNLNAQGSGKVGQALIDAWPDAAIRGYVIERAQPDASESLSGRGPWGVGVLSVLRTKADSPGQPYIGTVPLSTGWLDQDLAHYWQHSEQVPSIVSISARHETAILIQALPDATAELRASLLSKAAALRELVSTVAPASDPALALSALLPNMTFRMLEQKPISYRCECSLEKVKRALMLAGASELEYMLAKDKGASVHCDFCATDYKIDPATLCELIDAARS